MDPVTKLTGLLYETLIRNNSGLELLLKKGANPNLILQEYGVTPFHIAVGIGKESYGFHATKLFLQFGGNPNVRSIEGVTPVHVAAVWGKVTTLHLLLVNGGNPWLTDEDGRNAFRHAYQGKQRNTLRLLEQFQWEDGNIGNAENGQKYSETLVRVIFGCENLSLEYVTDLPQQICVPEARSASTQTSYFRFSSMLSGTEVKRKESNKLCGEVCCETSHIKVECVQCTNIEHNMMDSSHKGCSKCDGNDLLCDLKDAMKCEEDTGSIKESAHPYTDDDKKSERNVSVHYTLLHSNISKINAADSLLEELSRRNSSISCDMVSGELHSFEKDGNVLSYHRDKDSFSSEKYSRCDLRSAVLDSHHTHMRDGSFVNFVSENEIKDKCVKAATCVSSEDMFGSLLTEDDSSAWDSAESKCTQNYTLRASELITSDEDSWFQCTHTEDKCTHNYILRASDPITSQVSDLITSDEDDPSVPHMKRCVQLPAVSTFKQVPSLHENDDNQNTNTLLPLCEEFRYTDEEGVVLMEKRFLVHHSSVPLHTEDRIFSSTTSDVSVTSTVVSLPVSLDYDSDTLRKDLKKLGQEIGPITPTTKRVYLKRLYALHKQLSLPPPKRSLVREYSKELMQSLDDVDSISLYAPLERAVTQQFSAPDPTCQWREGVLKTSFTYLLLDPRVSSNLPCRCETLSKQEQWSIFLASVFYVGKGRRSRPYAHLHEAVTAWNKPRPLVNSKVRHILEIWRMDLGVVCLHVFQTVIPVEAFTREAAMIDAIGLGNLKNSRRGEYYGVASMWPKSKQQQLGTYLLYRALQMFLIEGERQVRPDDI